MVLGIHRRAVGVFTHRRDAEHALHELRDSGFAMDRVSVVVQDADRNDDIAGAEVKQRIGDKADEGATLGAVSGGALGGLTGLLVGLGTLAIPGIGPIMLAGATATTLATTLAGVGIGAAAGSLLGALIGLGIPEERARVYNERVERGHYLVIVDGTDAEMKKAEAILQHRGIEEFGIYDHPNGKSGTTNYVSTPTAATLNRSIALTKNAVGYFSNVNDAEVAISDLRAASFPLSQVSLIHKDFSQPEQLTSVAVSDRFDAIRLGLPDERARFYNNRIHRGDYVVIINGTDDELRQASSILSRYRIQEWQIYDPTLISSTSPDYAAVPVARTATTVPQQTIQRRQQAIGVFSDKRDAEAALTELRDAGFSLNNVSLIAKDADIQNPIAGTDRKDLAATTKTDEGAKTGAVTGATIGGLGGLLVGLGALAIPGVGPVIIAGEIATTLATALAGGVIGAAAGGIAGGLAGLGIPEERARGYSDRFNRGHYLVIIEGTDTEIQRAEAVLRRRGIEDFIIYDASPGDNRGVRQTAILDNTYNS